MGPGFLKATIIVLAWVAFWGCIASAGAENLPGVVKGFLIPLFNAENQQTGQLEGEAMTFQTDQNIKIEKARADFRPENQVRSFKMRTLFCTVLREKNRVVTDQPVTIESEGIVLDGYGMTWDLDKGVLTLKKQVTVDIQRSKLPRIPEP